MKILRFTAVFVATAVLLCVFTNAAGSTEFDASSQLNISETDRKNNFEFEKRITEFMKNNNLDQENFSFGYYDFKRGITFTYNSKAFFRSYELLKLPVSYCVYDKYKSGAFDASAQIGGLDFKSAFKKSISEEDFSITDIFIERLGGFATVKREIRQYADCDYPSDFEQSDILSVEYCIQFLENYYREAMEGSAEFAEMLIEPIKNYTADYLGKYSGEYSVTHRYGFSASAANDAGIVNTQNPYALVIFVSDSKSARTILEEAAKIAYDFNINYQVQSTSANTTLPDVPKEEKKAYDYDNVNRPAIYVCSGIAVLAVAGVAVWISVRRRGIS